MSVDTETVRKNHDTENIQKSPSDSKIAADSSYSLVITICIYVIIVILFLTELLINLRGLDTNFYLSLNTSTVATLNGSIVGSIIGYLFLLIGYLYLRYEEPENAGKLGYLTGVVILGLVLSVLWEVTLFYGNDIGIAIIIYVMIAAIYTWFTYEIFLVSPITALFQLPLLIRTYVLLYQNITLYLLNSQYSSIRPIPKGRRQ